MRYRNKVFDHEPMKNFTELANYTCHAPVTDALKLSVKKRSLSRLGLELSFKRPTPSNERMTPNTKIISIIVYFENIYRLA